MTRKPGAPMPASLRALIHSTTAHPAHAVPCPHCRAETGKPCRLRTTGRRIADTHQQRVNAWAQATASCPQCQVAPRTPCHDNGRARSTVHHRRYQEAEATAA